MRQTRLIALGAVLVGLLVGVGVTRAARRPPEAPPAVSALPAATLPPLALAPLASDTEAPSTAAVQEAPLRERVVYRTRTVTREPRVYVRKRSGKKSAAIIAGSAAGGAIVGAVVGGKKGAIIGGLVGGGAGTVYDRKTRKRRVYR